MNTFGWLLIAGGAALIWAAATDRVFDEDGTFILPQSLTDLFTAAVTGDTSGLKPASGTGIGAATPAVVVAEQLPGSADTPTAIQPAGDILGAAKRLGGVAKGYRWAATGPAYYDCSGLVWQAVRTAHPKLRGLPRFIVGTMRVGPWRKHFTPISTPAVGDIVYWGPNQHVGIVDGPGTFYSARNPRSGIGTSRIDGFLSSKPKFLRFVP